MLTNSNNCWLTHIPEDIASGSYMLTHAIIALHYAADIDGAQAYPFDYNFVADSSGTANPDDILATEF